MDFNISKLFFQAFNKSNQVQDQHQPEMASDRLSEAYMVYQKDFKSNRKGIDKRYG